MHEIVQPLLSARSDLENPEEKTVGQPSNIDTVRLPEKHFPVSRYPTKKTCNVCDCKKNTKNMILIFTVCLAQYILCTIYCMIVCVFFIILILFESIVSRF